jgi:hypothetical protein
MLSGLGWPNTERGQLLQVVNWYLWGSLDVLFASNKTLTRSREQHAKNPPKKGGAAFIDID